MDAERHEPEVAGHCDGDHRVDEHQSNAQQDKERRVGQDDRHRAQQSGDSRTRPTGQRIGGRLARVIVDFGDGTGHEPTEKPDGRLDLASGQQSVVHPQEYGVDHTAQDQRRSGRQRQDRRKLYRVVNAEAGDHRQVLEVVCTAAHRRRHCEPDQPDQCDTHEVQEAGCHLSGDDCDVPAASRSGEQGPRRADRGHHGGQVRPIRTRPSHHIAEGTHHDGRAAATSTATSPQAPASTHEARFLQVIAGETTAPA